MATESGRDRLHTWRWRGQRWGFEYSPIVHEGVDYLVRWILYIAGATLRLHKFVTGDERGPIGLHIHPFWFVTFPFQSYTEAYWAPNWDGRGPSWTDPGTGIVYPVRKVRAFRFHFRGHGFRHRVLELEHTPVWTFVITGRYTQRWGFYPDPDTFVPFISKRGTTNAADPSD